MRSLSPETSKDKLKILLMVLSTVGMKALKGFNIAKSYMLPTHSYMFVVWHHAPSPAAPNSSPGALTHQQYHTKLVWRSKLLNKSHPEEA